MKGLNEQFMKTYAIREDTPCYEIELDARELLSSRRFDFLAKYAYILFKEQNYASDYAEKVYYQHLDILTQGTFREFGDAEKVSYEKFIMIFHQLMESIREQGFDSDQSKVPLSKDLVPLNGAHRISCCLYYQKKVHALCFPELNSVNLNYEFFRRKGMPETQLDFMASQYSAIKPDSLYGCCIWPKASACKSIQDILHYFEAFGDIVYCKSIAFTYQGLMNLMIELYGKEPWTGGYEHMYGGMHQKVEKCFHEHAPCYFVLFEKNSSETIRDIKEQIRSNFDLGTNSVHITDDERECSRLCELLLKEQSIHFLNHGKFLKKHTLEQMHKEWKGQLMDASATLYLYGIVATETLRACEDEISEDVLHDPDATFLYQGMRLMSLSFIIKQYPQYEERARQLWQREKQKKPKKMFLKKLYGKIDYSVFILLNRMHLYDKVWKIKK